MEEAQIQLPASRRLASCQKQNEHYQRTKLLREHYQRNATHDVWKANFSK
jgi:hypothetical protein